jgi:hypothetical protein
VTNVWTPGMERIQGSGRAKGTPNKRTLLTRAGIRSAFETLRAGEGQDPLAAAFKIAKFLEDMSAKRLEKFKNEVADLPPHEFALIQDGLIAAANLNVRLAEFAFPKLSRVNYVGDAPTVNVDNRFVVELKIGAKRHAPPLAETNPVIDGTVERQPGNGSGGPAG